MDLGVQPQQEHCAIYTLICIYHDVIKLLYYEHWTEKQKYFHEYFQLFTWHKFLPTL